MVVAVVVMRRKGEAMSEMTACARACKVDRNAQGPDPQPITSVHARAMWNACTRLGPPATHLRKRPEELHELVESGVLLVHERLGRQRPVSAEHGLLAQPRLQRILALGRSLPHIGGRQERLGHRSIYPSLRAEGCIIDRDLVRAKATACIGGIWDTNQKGPGAEAKHIDQLMDA